MESHKKTLHLLRLHICPALSWVTFFRKDTHCLVPCSESTFPCYTWLVKCSAFGSWTVFLFQKVVFQFHRFHSLQVVDYLLLVSETAVSLRFHFKIYPQPLPSGGAGVGKSYIISEWLRPNHSAKHHELGCEWWLFVVNYSLQEVAKWISRLRSGETGVKPQFYL